MTRGLMFHVKRIRARAEAQSGAPLLDYARTTLSIGISIGISIGPPLQRPKRG